MVTFELNESTVPAGKEYPWLAEARKKPIVYDEDSPELTEAMEQAFIAARKAKPYRGEAVTLYVSPTTLEKAKSTGADYVALLGKLLDRAVEEYLPT